MFGNPSPRKSLLIIVSPRGERMKNWLIMAKIDEENESEVTLARVIEFERIDSLNHND